MAAARDVPQGEGCEQFDALAPAPFALEQHEALCRAAAALHPDDALMVFLDFYIPCSQTCSTVDEPRSHVASVRITWLRATT